MKLSERKKKILQIVVDDYIETAVPVSSKNITDKYMKDVSSATVRSELSALEELGYLTQLHTSSGRVPSPEAYKLYVSELMVKDKLSVKELNYIKKIFTEKSGDIEYVIKNAVKIISELTDYTSIGVPAAGTDEKIEIIKLVKIKPDAALVLIVTQSRLYKDNYINFPESVSEERINNASDMLTKIFAGKTMVEVAETSFDALAQFEEYKEIFYKVIDALKEYAVRNENVFMEGEEKILNHPEYADVDRIKNFLSVVSSNDKMVNILHDDGRDISISVKIGSEENADGVPEGCSVVSATYSANGQKLGTYGVIGPSRMDYQKVVAVLENVGKILENILSNK
ncbi:MAG: heat-inducible transcription repressor HrcA [Clostridia bacterium]|nr:heat-inducible transcription repressor HrcA [Clostridia bacterium]